MTHNQMIKCNICETPIRLRMQLGYFSMPFNFCCPECKTQIYGNIIFDQEKPYHEDNRLNIEYEINNATQADDSELYENPHYVAEQSAEFPQKKIYKTNSGKNFDCTPFIRSMEMLGENAQKIISNTVQFSNFIHNGWKELKTLYDLFYNKKTDIVTKKLTEISNRFIVKNDLDIIMALHQLCVATFNQILPQRTLTKYLSVADRINELFKTKHDKIVEYIEFCVSADLFDQIEKKALKLLDYFCKNYEKLLPALSLILAENRKINFETFGISTVGFEELKFFYSDSYEFILEYLDIILGLNNLYERNDFNNCVNNERKVSTFADIQKLSSKYYKLDLMKDVEPFGAVMKLDNRIRNAIAHYSNGIDANTQKITFIDRHKGNEKKEELYLLEFAMLCVDNFHLIFYINELAYALRKISYILDGTTPHILPFENNVAKSSKNKIGRNDLCPCGSGKKYKHCCLE